MTTLFAYDRWANARVLGAVSKTSADEFTKDLGSSHRSLRDTLVHILSAELVWLSRWKGQSPQAHMDPAQLPNIKVLQARWSEVENQLQTFLASLNDAKLQANASYSTFGGQVRAQPLWQQMAHLVNHSSYHRGQITTMLRQLGAAPVATDLIVFFRERPARS